MASKLTGSAPEAERLKFDMDMDVHKANDVFYTYVM